MTGPTAVEPYRWGVALAFPLMLAVLAVAMLLLPSRGPVAATDTAPPVLVEVGAEVGAETAAPEAPPQPEPEGPPAAPEPEPEAEGPPAAPEPAPADPPPGAEPEPDDPPHVAEPAPADPVPGGEPAPADPPPQPDPGPVAPLLLMPVEGVRVADVWPSFGDPRGGGTRSHAGVDIMAPRGTPVRAAAAGTVWRAGGSRNGGISVTIIDDAGVRYFYTHLDAIAPDLEARQRVGVDTVIGFVGNTGNAAATAPHLHFEVSLPVDGEDYAWSPIDPLPLLLDREEW